MTQEQQKIVAGFTRLTNLIKSVEASIGSGSGGVQLPSWLPLSNPNYQTGSQVASSISTAIAGLPTPVTTWSGLTGQAPNNSIFPNTSGYQTSAQVTTLIGSTPKAYSTITGTPTLVSAFTNDNGYQTAAQVAAAISAGGGSGGGSTDVNAARYTGATWAALGTSITADGVYTGQLTTLSGMILTNLGVSGATWGGNSTTTGGAIYNATDNIATGTKVITLEGMKNDWGFGAALGTVNDTVLNTIYGVSFKLMEKVKTAFPSAIVFVIGEYTTNWSGYTLTAGGYLNANGVSDFQVNEALRQAANRTGCIFIDVTESGIGIPTSATNMRDNLHLSTVGGKCYADLVWQRMKQYNIDPTNSYSSTTVVTPAFSPTPNTYTGTQSVTISTSTSGATIYYTTDGSTPTTSSTVYSSAISVTATTTIKALAAKSGMTTSAVASGTYTITTTVATPSFSPAGGSLTGNQSVTIATTTSGSTIYYTIDGSTPTTSSSVYSAPITLTAPSTTTIKALAVKSGLTNSPIGTSTYTLTTSSTPVTYPNPIVNDNGYNLAAITNADLTSVNVTGMTIASDGSITGTLSAGYIGSIALNKGGVNNAIQITLADIKQYGPGFSYSKGTGGTQAIAANPITTGVLNNGFIINNAGTLTAYTVSPNGPDVGNPFGVNDKFRIRGNSTSVTIEYQKVNTTTWVTAWSGNPSTQTNGSTHAGTTWLGFAYGLFDGEGLFKECYTGTYTAP